MAAGRGSRRPCSHRTSGKRAPRAVSGRSVTPTAPGRGTPSNRTATGRPVRRCPTRRPPSPPRPLRALIWTCARRARPAAGAARPSRPYRAGASRTRAPPRRYEAIPCRHGRRHHFPRFSPTSRASRRRARGRSSAPRCSSLGINDRHSLVAQTPLLAPSRASSRRACCGPFVANGRLSCFANRHDREIFPIWVLVSKHHRTQALNALMRKVHVALEVLSKKPVCGSRRSLYSTPHTRRPVESSPARLTVAFRRLFPVPV